MCEVEKIRGGFKNVPDHLKTKTQLKNMGLEPIGEPNYQVWTSYNWVMLYDISETEERNKPSQKQLEALEKARGVKAAKRLQEEELKAELELEARLSRQRGIGLMTFGEWYERDFLILDTETTDLYGEVIELSIIDRNGKVLFDNLVKPKSQITEGAFNVHGIDESMVSNSPGWPEVYHEVNRILKDKLVLMYNADFDVQTLSNTCSMWGLDDLTNNFEAHCVMEAFADYCDSPWFSLEEASGEYTSHRALDDCFSTLKVIEDIWKQLNIISVVKNSD